MVRREQCKTEDSSRGACVYTRVQGVATLMYPVLASATGIKLQSMDQDGFLVAIKGSRQFLGGSKSKN